MRIITFCGVDGSGKTTQRELLQRELEALGKNVAYFHATEFSLANRLARSAKKQASFTPGSEKAVSSAGFTGVFLRLIFLSLDALRFEWYAAGLRKQKTDYLLSDRFFQDSLLNICYLSQNMLVRAYAKLLARVLPAVDVTFYLQLTTNDILERSRVPEQGEAYLDQKIALYNHPPFPWPVTALDATKTKETIAASVLSTITL
jgi:thymidylate kinase